MVCGRTLGWKTGDVPRLWVIPRGMNRRGGTDPGAATWASRYGFVPRTTSRTCRPPPNSSQ
jgi:penicillin V acylase-like amidase (Ntn superfamily)